MTVININKMELPMFDVIQAAPIFIPLEKYDKKQKIEDVKHLIFKIPSVDKYFTFEAKYLTMIAKYMAILSNVSFLEYHEFADMKLKEQMLKELHPLMQHLKFKKELTNILIKYFDSNFDIKTITSIVNPIQYSYLFLFIHSIIQIVKKNSQQVLQSLGKATSGISSSFSKPPSVKIEPRF